MVHLSECWNIIWTARGAWANGVTFVLCHTQAIPILPMVYTRISFNTNTRNNLLRWFQGMLRRLIYGNHSRTNRKTRMWSPWWILGLNRPDSPSSHSVGPTTSSQPNRRGFNQNLILRFLAGQNETGPGQWYIPLTVLNKTGTVFYLEFQVIRHFSRIRTSLPPFRLTVPM